ncbi:MAG: hypothetical protein EPN93_14675 [Spirochaetes bacterium]|nr:MAG: hypothetical protein EPN93_14675 [Spirochaetota bacterium]
MKMKTSITIANELLQEIDTLLQGKGNRSGLIEKAVKEYIDRIKRTGRNKTDIELINSSLEELNKEALDVLDYQVKS